MSELKLPACIDRALDTEEWAKLDEERVARVIAPDAPYMFYLMRRDSIERETKALVEIGRSPDAELFSLSSSEVGGTVPCTLDVVDVDRAILFGGMHGREDLLVLDYRVEQGPRVLYFDDSPGSTGWRLIATTAEEFLEKMGIPYS